MNEDQFREQVERLLAVTRVVEQLPPEIRERAFMLFENYVVGHVHKQHLDPKRQVEQDKANGDDEPGDTEAFFGKFDHDKPADNVRLIAAWWYSQYGVAPFTVDLVKVTATDVGLTIPDRLDMTLSSATSDGKKVFARAGRAAWKPTVTGEKFLKASYGIKKGKLQPPEAI